MSDELKDWEDWRLAQELQFRLRFEKAGTNEVIDMHSRILCEAVARLLLRIPDPKNKDERVRELEDALSKLANRVVEYFPKGRIPKYLDCDIAVRQLARDGLAVLNGGK